MKCPKCRSELVRKYYKGMIEVDACPNCRGIWLDLDDLTVSKMQFLTMMNTKARWYISRQRQSFYVHSVQSACTNSSIGFMI